MGSKNDQKTMDVTQPGDTAPDTTARPVIVTHRPMVQDPMMKAEEKTEENPTPEPPKKAEPVHNKVIQPLNEESTKENKEPEVISEAAPEQKPETSESATVDAVVSGAGSTNKKKKDEQSSEEKAKQETLQKLTADKTYFVPIGQGRHRRNSHRAWTALTLLIVTVIVGAYLAVDAGIIQTSVTLPVDVIKN